MIVLRERVFSINPRLITEKLDKAGVEDYSIESRIPNDAISISLGSNPITINLPEDYEYSQYGIDSFIRSMVSYARTNTVLDRDIYKMMVSTQLNETQLYKLVKYIIEENEFCVLV